MRLPGPRQPAARLGRSGPAVAQFAIDVNNRAYNRLMLVCWFVNAIGRPVPDRDDLRASLSAPGRAGPVSSATR